MNHEPVAWMSNGKEFYVQKNYCPDFIPLYTHPVKEPMMVLDGNRVYPAFKELTDEEIGQFKGEWYRGDYASFYDLVRAILRKAQNG